jgi:hypothetical protein
VVRRRLRRSCEGRGDGDERMRERERRRRDGLRQGRFGEGPVTALCLLRSIRSEFLVP